MNRKLVAFLDDPFRLVDLREVELRIDTLGEQVERERYEIDIAGSFAVSEQRPLDAVGAGHQTELRGRDGRSAIVVRVHAQHDPVACRDVPLEPLDPVGVDVRRKRLDGRRQVDDHRRLAGWLPNRDHRLANLQRELELRPVEALRRVLEHSPQ